MAGRTVTTPSGARWRVRRQWAPRLGSESMWERFRRRTRLSRRFARDASDVPDPGCAADALDELALVLAVVLIVGFLFFVGIPLLVALLDVVLLLVLTLVGVAARVVFRRPWVIEAKALDPLAAPVQDGVAWPADPATAAVRRFTWRVVGWRESRDAVDQVADALAHGIALPPGAESSRAPGPRNP